jgi:hypothetical protein
MITHYDFATGQIVDNDKVADDARAAATTAGITRTRLLSVDEARADEQSLRRRRFDSVILESLVDSLNG